MANLPVGVQVHIAVSAIVAAFMHWRVRRYMQSSGVAAIVSPFAFAATCALFNDAPSEVPSVAVFLLFVGISLAVALAVGIPFAIFSRLRTKSD